MRLILLIATLAIVAVQFTQVFCDSSSEGSSSEDSSSEDSSSEEVSLEETSEEIARLAKENDVSVKTMTDRLTLVAKIKKLPIWNYLNTIEQERLRAAIIKDVPVPKVWQRILAYKDIINPEKSDVLQDLINHPELRKAMMIELPPVSNEWTVGRAMATLWWPTLRDCQKKTVARYIIRGESVPEGFSSWAEAVVDHVKLGKWVAENKKEVLSKEC